MIRLSVHTQDDTEQVDLDLIGDEVIDITFEVDDIRELSSKNSSYSKVFDVPATKSNNLFFKNVYDIQVDSVFNPYLRSNAIVSEDGIIIFEGAMYLDEVLRKDNTIIYKCRVVSDTVNFLDTLGEQTLADIDYTDLDHTTDEQTIEDSWQGLAQLTAGGTSDAIFYPLVNTGNTVFNYMTNPAEIHIQANQNFVPWVSLKYIIDKIFALAGFSYESSFINSVMFNELFTDTNMNDQTSDHEYAEVYAKYYVGTCGAFTLTSTPTVIPMCIEVFDDSNLYDNATFTYTSPADATNVVVDAALAFIGDVGETIESYLSVTRAGDTEDILVGTHIITDPYGAYAPNPPAATTTKGVYIQEMVYGLEFGDTIQIKCKTIGNGWVSLQSGYNIWDYTVNPPIQFNFSWTALSFTTYTGAHSIDYRMTNYRKDTKLRTIVSDLMKLFNLYVEPINAKRLFIEPYKDYIAGGTTLYWDDKLDTVEEKHEYIEQPKKITWRYNNDDDDWLIYVYSTVMGYEYGSFSVYPNADGEEQEIKLEVFSATAGVPNKCAYIYQQDDGTLKTAPFDNAPRLQFRPNVMKPGTVIDANNVVSFDNYNTASNFDEPFGVPVNDLNFGASLYSSQLGFPRTLYDTYYHRYIQDRYSKESVIVTMYFKLTASDIANFSFKNVIVVKNQAYRVNKIEYKAGVSELAKVEILKVFPE